MNKKQIQQILTAPITIVLALSAVALVAAVLLASPADKQADANKVQAAENTEQNEPQKTEDEATETETTEEDAVLYEYVAQAGDSFSKIARKAVQTYGLKHDVSLSQAQILFAETNLTLEASSPLLSQGEAVTVDEAAVKAWVDKAEDLSDEKEAAWAAYTVGVNFNTDNVGEAR